jgi:hypothetical protein
LPVQGEHDEHTAQHEDGCLQEDAESGRIKAADVPDVFRETGEQLAGLGGIIEGE